MIDSEVVEGFSWCSGVWGSLALLDLFPQPWLTPYASHMAPGDDKAGQKTKHRSTFPIDWMLNRWAKP